MSDGADTLRRLQQNIAPEAEHVLDWFHVTMRLTVLSDDKGGLGRRGHGRDRGSRSEADQMAALARQCPGCDR